MFNTLGEVLKTLIIFLVVAQVGSIFLRRTYAGRCLITIFKIIREMFRLAFICLDKSYKFLSNQVQKRQPQKTKSNPPQRKVANGDNIIQFSKHSSRPKPGA